MTTDQETTTIAAGGRLRLHDTVELVSKMFFDDDRPREGRVVAVDGDHVSVEFPDPHGRPDYPTLTFHVPPDEQRHFKVVRRGTDELDKARAETASLRERLAEIGTYAAECGLSAGDPYSAAPFQRIARLARS